MKSLDFQKSCLSYKQTIHDALKCLNSSSLGIIFVLNKDDSLLGTVSDGDVRRSLLRGAALDDNIKNCTNTEFYAFQSGVGLNADLVLAEKSYLKAVPELDDKGRILAVHQFEQNVSGQNRVLRNTAVIMAGGEGKRLLPLTETCPKPMLEVGGKPIIQMIIDKCKGIGIKNFLISVNYKKEKIIEYLGDGSSNNISISYLEENYATGTAGSLGLIKEELNEPVFVINGDLLIEADLSSMLELHKQSNCSLTIGIKAVEFEFPYGVVKHDGSEVTDVKEKPLIKEFVSAGIHILEPFVINDMVGAEKLDMPDLIKRLLAKKCKVTPFVIHEKWLDIGLLANLEEAKKNW